MTRDEIIGIALKVGFPDWWLHPPEPERQDGEVIAMLGRFAALVAAHEREACFQVCRDIMDDFWTGDDRWETARHCSEMILERGKK